MRRRINRVGGVLTLAVCLAVAVVSLVPGGSLPIGIVPNGDKWGHFLAYSAVGFCFFLSFLRPEGSNIAGALAAVLCSGLLGGLIELVQPFFGRSMEGLDLVCDIAGAILGAGAGESLWLGLKKRKNWTDSALWFKLFSKGSVEKICCEKERR